MSQRTEKSDLSSASEDSETLREIARQITLSDQTDSAEATRKAAKVSRAHVSGNGSAATDSIQELIAERIFEALPAGLALCSGREILRANSAFAMAFGYASVADLTAESDLQAIFPGDAESFDQPHDPEGEQQQLVSLAAVTRSRRRIVMPLAIHEIADRDGLPIRLLVLHPQPQQHTERTQDRVSAKASEQTAREDSGPDDSGSSAAPKQAELSGEAPVSSPETDCLAKISHGVRTPLNTIIGFAELMKDEQLGPIGNDRYRRYVGDILDSGRYALSIINDLLDISRLEAGQFELNFTSVDLNEVIAGCIRVVQAESHESRVFLRLSLSDDLPGVLADRDALEQILLNLLNNAIKFTNPGGQIVISSKRIDSGGVRLRVRDNGVGLSADDIAQAMHPYSQSDTAPRKMVGTGLVLPLARALAQANRAEFTLKSAPSSGTCVDIVFPEARLAGR